MLIRTMAGPLIGAVIGYCTNYIAVKMLFYPRKEIRIGGFLLPFTPGAIPKGQKRLAGAVGRIVEEQLLTAEDIRKRLTGENTVRQITDKVLQLTDLTVQEAGTKIVGEEESFQQVQEKISMSLTDEIMDSINRIPLADIIVEKGSSVIKERTAGTMLQMFLSDSLILSITGPVSTEIENYIQENGKEFVEKEVRAKVGTLTGKTIRELLTAAEPEEQILRERIGTLYTEAAEQILTGLAGQLGIAQMVEDKIAAMDVLELETLVLTVMKKELNTIVNLGALIGLILGTLNLFL